MIYFGEKYSEFVTGKNFGCIHFERKKLVFNRGEETVINTTDMPMNSETIYEEDPETGEWKEFVRVEYDE